MHKGEKHKRIVAKAMTMQAFITPRQEIFSGKCERI